MENTFAGFPGEPLASWGTLGAGIRAKDRDACPRISSKKTPPCGPTRCGGRADSAQRGKTALPDSRPEFRAKGSSTTQSPPVTPQSGNSSQGTPGPTMPDHALDICRCSCLWASTQLVQILPVSLRSRGTLGKEVF